MEWLWESYQISTELYEDVNPGQTIDEAYYKKYIKTIHLRIDQAGIRLAGELNRLLKDTKASIDPISPLNKPVATSKTKIAFTQDSVATEIELKDVKAFLKKDVSVSGKVYSVKDIGSMVLVNLGAAYPNQLLTVVLKGDAKQLASQIEGKTISVEGAVIDYKGKPEIVVTDPNKISISK
jgi:hypothetical protein